MAYPSCKISGNGRDHATSRSEAQKASQGHPRHDGWREPQQVFSEQYRRRPVLRSVIKPGLEATEALVDPVSNPCGRCLAHRDGCLCS